MDNWLQQTQSVVFWTRYSHSCITQSSVQPVPGSPPKKGIIWPVFGQTNQLFTNKEIPPTHPRLH